MVRDGGQAWREGPTFDYISIRSPIIRSSSAGAAEHLCLSVGPPPPKQPGSPPNTEAVMVKCSGADPRQIFKLGPCSEYLVGAGQDRSSRAQRKGLHVLLANFSRGGARV